MERELEKALENLVRVGIVTDVDKDALRVRVKYPDMEMTSGWLHVLQHPGAEVSIAPDGVHTHEISDSYTGGGSAGEGGSHDHTPGSYLTVWLPKVNDAVLVLYLPVFNGDGYVLGRTAADGEGADGLW